jgi:hypothetical protein
MTIVTSDYRPKRARKRSPAIPQRIVGSRAPQTSAPVIKEAVPVRKPPAQAATITGPRIVTARKPRSKHGPPTPPGGRPLPKKGPRWSLR